MPKPFVSPPVNRLDELDGLRGILSLWVAVSHILCWSGYFSLAVPKPLGGLWLHFIAAQPAVEIFIILSGFVISFLIDQKRTSYREFIKGRFFRIYPVYLVCLLVGVATTILTPYILNTAQWRHTIYFEWVSATSASELSATASHLTSHVTLLNGVIPKRLLPEATATLLTPAWSISLEWQYYLVAPFIAKLIRSGIGILVLALISAIGLKFGPTFQNPHIAFLPAQLPLFLIGIGCFHLYARLKNNETDSEQHLETSVAALAAAGILISWHSVAVTIWALAFGCILVRRKSVFGLGLAVIRRTLLHPIPQWLGKVSFPLYLIHWPLILIFLSALLHWNPTITSHGAASLMLAFGLPLILVAAIGLHKCIERPFMELGKRLKRVNSM